MTDAPRNKQGTNAVLVREMGVLKENKHVCVGFHEVICILYDQVGLTGVLTGRVVMVRRLIRQCVLHRLVAPCVN